MLKFTTSKTEVLLPVKKHFRIKAEMPEVKNEADFIHPLTGMRHRIYINEVKLMNALMNARDRFPQYDENNPYYFAGISYELRSALSKGEAELGKHGYPLENVFTRMHWNPLKEIEMSIVGLYKAIIILTSIPYRFFAHMKFVPA